MLNIIKNRIINLKKILCNDNKNNIIETNYAEYNENKNFKSKGPTKLLHLKIYY